MAVLRFIRFSLLYIRVSGGGRRARLGGIISKVREVGHGWSSRQGMRGSGRLGKRGKTTHSRCFARGKVHFCRKSERKGSLVPEFLREPPEKGLVDTLPLRSSTAT
jgi:hypothetical protein